MADYLSRHPSEYEGAVAKAEDLFKDWFTKNVLDEISPKLPQLVKTRKPIKLREITNAKRKITSGVLTLHETVQTIYSREKAAKTPIKEAMTEFKDLSKLKISNDYVKSNAKNDRLIQKLSNWLKTETTPLSPAFLLRGGKDLIPL